MLRPDNSIKIWRNLPISNLKPDLHNINAHTKFGENPLCLLKLSSGNKKWMDGQMDRWLTDEQADRQTDRHKDIQSETIIPRHYHVVGYKNTTFSYSSKKAYVVSTHQKCRFEGFW